MNTEQSCLPADLRSWLLAPHSEQEAQNWSQHLEQCPHCRQRIEAEPPSLAWSNILREDAWDQEFSSSCEVPARPNQSTAIDKGSLEKLALHVVDRSDNPAMLGRLGEFEILEPIGMGGMSLVLKGYDHELNRFVAIKALAPHLAIVGAARQRFAREAQAAASIVDPHVVPIHSVVADHDPPYLVMSYIPGQTLQANIDAAGAIDVLVAVRIAQQVAMGLAAAHAQGLIHRDIKPSNILLERNVQRAYIADFGLARAADDASLTRSGFLAGTPDYMSPEQARGEALDARSDLFSLGSVIYTMLTGHPPFRAESPLAVLSRIAKETPRSTLANNPCVPVWLDNMVMRLLSKQPSDRFENSQEVGQLLEGALRHLQDPIACPLPAALATPKAKRVVDRICFLRIGATICSFLMVAAALFFFWPNAFIIRSEPSIDDSTDPFANSTTDPFVGPQKRSATQPRDVEWKNKTQSLTREMDETLRMFKPKALPTPEDSGNASGGESGVTASPSDNEFLDRIRSVEQQMDEWTIQLQSKGKS